MYHLEVLAVFFNTIILCVPDEYFDKHPEASVLDYKPSKCYSFFYFSCQEAFLSSMVLGPNIARNAALRENVFMMAVCVELRIPLFVVGKPGSSKSLAKSIIAESMKGHNSKNDFLKKFNSVSLKAFEVGQWVCVCVCAYVAIKNV